MNALEPAANRRRKAAKTAGLVSALVGVAAAGVAAGVATERLLLRRSRRPDPQDPHAEEPFGQLPYDECLTVRTSDGIDLYVEVVEPNDGIDVDFDYLDLPHSTSIDPTLVFVHGFCLDMGTFHFQRSRADPARRLPDGLLRPARARPLRPPGHRRVHARRRWPKGSSG